MFRSQRSRAVLDRAGRVGRRQPLHHLRLEAIRVDHKKFQITLPESETTSRRYVAQAATALTQAEEDEA